MNRKKFVKQLMAADMPRNDAADCATLCQNCGRKYAEALDDLLTYHRPKFKNASRYWRRIRGAIIHGTNSQAYSVLYGGAIDPADIMGRNDPAPNNMQVVTGAVHAAIHGAGGGG